MTAFIFASIVSFRAVLFFLLYMFAIWIYSFRVKRFFWLSNLYAALLMILPFWAITLYFKNFDTLVFYHAGYLFFLILARDIIKDLENFKGDWVHRYKTLPIVFDNKSTKWITTLCLLGCLFPNFHIINHPLGLMFFYYVISPLYLILVLVFLWRANDQKTYLWLHNLIKAWILIGVLSISLIPQGL
jgi:4-hydroxybenzoate polyprenyltransferase|tara:strand:- start:431 stop:991 length:561 start_codon:yes stop_codon:yes gene_type:complete